MRERKNMNNRGFSLLEVVIVVAIIAILAAIGIPRMSRGSRGANDSAVSGDLAVLRNAIDLYAAEHGGDYPTLASLKDALTKYSDSSGGTGDKSTTRVYGPYVRDIPPLPVGAFKGKTTFSATAGDANAGWIYEASSGKVWPNTGAATDDRGVLYSNY